MSILRPINYAGAWIPFRSPAPCPADDIAADPQVSISFNETWLPVVLSALKALTRPETYEGTITDINRCTADSHQLFDWSSTTKMQIGTIVSTVLGVLPSNWLACDGASHLRVDFPDLYAGLAAAFIVDADHFITPDLRGRTVIGVGTGPGLTARSMNNQGGHETHALSTAELAAHDHRERAYTNPPGLDSTEQYYWRTGISGPQTLPVISGPNSTQSLPAGGLFTSQTGSGTAHENMQPFTALTYAIVAK